MARISCPTCQFTANLPDDYSHPTVQCPKCKGVFELAILLPESEGELVLDTDEDSHPTAEDAFGNPVSALTKDGRKNGANEKRERKRFKAEIRHLNGCKSTGFWLLFLGILHFAYSALYLGQIVVKGYPATDPDQPAVAMLAKAIAIVSVVGSILLGTYYMYVGLKLRKLDPKTSMVWTIFTAMIALPIGLYFFRMGSLAIIAVLLDYDLNARYATEANFDRWIHIGINAATMVAFSLVSIIAGYKSIGTTVRIYKKHDNQN